MSYALFDLSHSAQSNLNSLYGSRLRLVLFTLVFEILILIPMMSSFLFIVGMFNLPAIMALIACAFRPSMDRFQAQKTTKTLLKVGIAKAVGGVLLAGYMGLKYALMSYEVASGSRTMMRTYAICLGASALVDILYSVFAYMAIRKTKDIIKILRRQQKSSSFSRRKNNSYLAYAMLPAAQHSSSGSGSTSCSEEEGSENRSQNSL